MITKEAPANLINSFQAFTEGSIARNVDKVIVAGGFIRAYYAEEKPADLDLYFRNEQDLQATFAELEYAGWELVTDTGMSMTMKKGNKVVQLVSYIYGEPEDIISKFDFTVCSAAMIINPTI